LRSGGGVGVYRKRPVGRATRASDREPPHHDDRPYPGGGPSRQRIPSSSPTSLTPCQGQFVPQAGGAPIPVDIEERWTLRDHKILELRPYYWNPKPLAEYATQSSRAHYAALVAKYFEYAHSNRLEEVVAMCSPRFFLGAVYWHRPSLPATTLYRQ
jgi:hypothetical protein